LQFEFRLAGKRANGELDRVSIGPSRGSEYGCIYFLASDETSWFHRWGTRPFDGTTRDGKIWPTPNRLTDGVRRLSEGSLKLDTWHRLEMIRFDDTLLWMLDDRPIRALADLRRDTKESPGDLGRSQISLGVASGEVSFRRIRIREIRAMPPEIVKLLP